MAELEKAIESIQRQHKEIGIDYSNGKDKTAICLLDNQAESIILALEKQIPKVALKKPIFEGERAKKLEAANIKGFVNYETLKCPICNNIVADRTPRGLTCKRFCNECGQALINPTA